MSARPPGAARLLVGLLCAAEDRELLLDDLAERYAVLADERGLPAARRWYWMQALRGVHARLSPDLDLLRRRTWRGTAGDVRQAVRSLRRRPLYAAGVVGTLAIGLASAATVLSVAWHVWLAPMPFPDPGRVVRLYELEPPAERAARGAAGGPSADAARTRWRLSPPLLEDLRSMEWTTVDAVAGVSRNMYDWARPDGTSRLPALLVSPEAFTILGVTPIAGRLLSGDPDAREVVLSEPFWRRAFGADPEILGGSTMTLNGVAHAVVGVVRLPSGYPEAADVVARLDFDEDDLVEGMRGARYLDVIARVDPGFDVGAAATEMDRIVAELGERFPNHEGWGGSAVALSDELMRPYRGVLGLLSAAGVVFLLLASVNVAGLVAARSVEGRRERAIRLALGASQSTLLRGGIVESVVLSTLGGVLALLAGYWLLGPLVALVPADVPRIGEVRPSLALAGSVLLASLAIGAAVGSVGYALSRGSPSLVGRSGADTLVRVRGRRVIVICQVALTTLLATSGAGILRQMSELRAVDVGFEPTGLVATQVLLSAERYPTPEARLVYWRSVLESARARALDVTVGTNAPMAGVNMPWGYRADPTEEQAFAQYHVVGTEYFRVLGIDLVEGRTFTPDDREGSDPVLVINETLAEAHFSGERAVGRTLHVLGQPKTIVGVVRATRHFGPGEPAPAEIYVPLGHDPWANAQVLVRGDERTTLPALTTVLERIDPALGVPPPEPYTRHVRAWFSALRLQAIIVGLLAVVGTLLATLGIYALVAYQVMARRREIGVRLALGASDARIFSDVVRQGVGLAFLGLLLGFAAWYASLPAAGDLLGDVDTADPLVPLAVALLVGTIAAVASALPAARSTAVDPATTLRAE